MKKILVIDDEEWLREMVHMALREKGFDVIEAENGAAGIEVARRELPDLILCDVNMEKVNGYLTLSALRSEPATAAIPFILMTGLADNAGMRHGMELGADDYLPKPFAIEALYAAVDARLKKAQALRQEAEKKLADLRDSISMSCRMSCEPRSTASWPTAKSSARMRRPCPPPKSPRWAR